MSVTLYGATLLGRAFKETHASLDNAAPATVDQDVGTQLQNHGICFGITLSWIIGFCHNRSEATTPSQFNDYFANVLRFQGAYFQVAPGLEDSVLLNLNGIYAHGLNKNASGKCTPGELNGLVTSPSSRLGAYLEIWGHAIGIGGHRFKRFIMEPNAGLFYYFDPDSFKKDLMEYCEQRRTYKGKDRSDKIHYAVYSAPLS